MLKLTLILIVLLTSMVAKAYEFKTYGGAYLGGNSLTVENAELDKTGYNLGVKVVGSLEYEKALVDLGAGWQYNFMSGSESGTDVEISTRSFFLDLDLLGRLTKDVAVGLATSTHLGVDNTYEESVGSSSTVVLAGGKMQYNFKIGDLNSRLEVAFMTNVTNSQYTNLVGNVGLQIELPFFKKEPKVVKRVIQKIEPVAVKENVKVTLKLAKVGFQTNESGLDKDTSSKITKLAKVLAKNPGLVERVKIAGHTDERGSKEYNNVLSQDRADAVLKAFVQGGFNEQSIQAVGYGFNQPLVKEDSPKAWDKNRRTEIEFFGVADRPKLNKLLEELK